MSSEPPSFVTPPESQAALPNATVRFKGIFKGTPPFTVKWFKDDKELMTGPTCFTGLDGLSCFLELYKVGVFQSGVYSCQVSNDAGSARCSADLTVKGWISIFMKQFLFHICITAQNYSFHSVSGFSPFCFARIVFAFMSDSIAFLSLLLSSHLCSLPHVRLTTKLCLICLFLLPVANMSVLWLSRTT